MHLSSSQAFNSSRFLNRSRRREQQWLQPLVVDVRRIDNLWVRVGLAAAGGHPDLLRSRSFPLTDGRHDIRPEPPGGPVLSGCLLMSGLPPPAEVRALTLLLFFETERRHSTTSSPRRRMEGGMVRPRALAVFKLTPSSNLMGCCTGSSAGFAPLMIRSTYRADRLSISGVFAP